MIKAVIFDLDNTLTDFMRMKENAVDAAVDAMVDAGLRFPPADIKKKIYEIYGREGIEFQTVFDHAGVEALDGMVAAPAVSYSGGWCVVTPGGTSGLVQAQFH